MAAAATQKLESHIACHFGKLSVNSCRISPTVSNCVIINNSGSRIYNLGSSPVMSNCAIADNDGFFGGGMDNLEGEPTVTNCVFSGNFAWTHGGGMYNRECRPVVTNCIFWDNNSVGDGDEIYNNDSEPFFGYCDIKDGGGSGDRDANLGIDLGGNIDADPCFADAGNPDGPDDNSDFKVRFRVNSGSNQRNAYIDDVEVTALESEQH